MASPKSRGRMLRTSISISDGFASLSPEAAVLFVLLIPHFSSHGKMPAGPGIIKDNVCPLISYLTYENITSLLQEISDRTNVKLFMHERKWYLQALHFNTRHQELRKEKLGSDKLPSFGPGLLQDSADLVPDYTREIQFSPGLNVESGDLVPDFPLRAEGFKVLRVEEEQNLKPEALWSVSVESPREDQAKATAVVEEKQIEAQVEEFVELHRRTCGLNSVPPLAIFRELLRLGNLAGIRDVFQRHGGDIHAYRQRNIVDGLIALRDGLARSPPRKKGRSGRSPSERRQEQTVQAAREFAGGCDGGSG